MCTYRQTKILKLADTGETEGDKKLADGEIRTPS